MLTAILAGIMLLSNILTAGAVDEEYFPTVLGLEAIDGEAVIYIRAPEKVEEMYDNYFWDFDMRNDNGDQIFDPWPVDTQRPSVWIQDGEKISCAAYYLRFNYLDRALSDLKADAYPVTISVYEENSTNQSIAQKETGFYIDINIIQALEVEDITFTADSDYSCAANLGAGYPEGTYIAYDSTKSAGVYTGSVANAGDSLILRGFEKGSIILQENLVLQRIFCTDISADGKTAYIEVTQSQHPNEIIVEPSLPTEPEEPTSSYLYDEPDPSESIDFSGMLDDVADEASAVDAVEQAAADLTDEQKQSETGIDKLTLLAEEAAAKATTVSASGGEVNVAAANVSSDVGSALSATTGALLDAGITTQRNARTILNYDAGSSETVSVTTEALPETVDRVRVTTDYAAATVDAQQASSFTMTDRGSRTVEVNFDTDSETMVTVSFMGMSMDETYVAVVDEEGNPVGGKYNPATGTLEAKLTESGVYQVVNNEKDFADIKAKSQEMQEAIKLLASKGIINGTTETMFEPDSTISRAEVTALLMRTLSLLDPNADGGFADVTPQNWYYGAAGSAKEHNIINGFEDNTFRGDAVIAKDQIVSVSARTLREQMDYKTPSDVTGELSIYTDAGNIANWAREDVALATMTNLVLKRTDGKFDGSAGMTRGDAAIIVKRLFDKLW